MPISLMLIPFGHFQFRPTLAEECIPDLTVRLQQNMIHFYPSLKAEVAKLVATNSLLKYPRPKSGVQLSDGRWSQRGATAVGE